MKKIYTIILLSSLFLCSACDSYLDIKPVGSVIPTTAEEYRALLAKAYKSVPASDRMLACLRSDEMLASDDEYDQNSYGDIEKWNDGAQNSSTAQINWANFYNIIFMANHVIENQHGITEGSTDVVNQLAGEAYLLRAYMHFLLVNFHGQPYTKPGALETKSIPLKLNNDLEAVLSRNTVEQVYTSILSDIEHARQLINKESWELPFSYRFTTSAVEALQSRVSLYMGQWKAAYDAAEATIAKKPALENLNAEVPMLPNNYKSVESITALEYMSSPMQKSCWASASFLALYGEGDKRFELYFSDPDKNGNRKADKTGRSEFASTFRAGEMYLTAAEAAAELDNLPQARKRLLNLMENRYTPEAYAKKVTLVNGMNKADLIKEILDERARELSFEGHRWNDLRRTTRPQIVKVLGGKTYTLNQDDQRYTMPIPKAAIEANPGLAN